MKRTPQRLLIVYHRFPPIAESLQAAFLRQGVDTQVFCTTDYEHWFYHRVIRTVNRLARSFRLVAKGTDLFKSHPLNQINRFELNFERVCSQYRPDAVLFIHGHSFGEALLSRMNVATVGWHVEPRDDLPYLIDKAKSLDIYNSFSNKDVAVLKEAGFDCRYLCHAVDCEKFFSQPGSASKFDVAFVGNWSEWRDDVVMAALEVSPNVAIYGGYWRKKSRIPKHIFRRIYKGEEIVGAELNSLYNETKIVLNASRTAGSNGLNMRFFEVLAAGSLLVTDTVPELETHFEPNTHLVVYRDVGELKQCLRQLLQNTPQMDAIRKAGQARVIACHQYNQMATYFSGQFEEIMGKSGKLR